MSHEWIDVSVPLRSGMPHWPDNPPVRIQRMLDMDQGAKCNVSTLSMGSHTGTHMDAPLHFIRDGAGMELLPLDAVMGMARVVEVTDPVSIKPEHLRAAEVSPGERILFKTINSTRCWREPKFVEDFVHLATEAAAELARLKVRTVGVDYLSVGGYKRNGTDVHRHLLGAGIWIIEGLDLSAVQPGRYELLCLPLKIAGGDGAPARALLRPL